MQEAAVYGLALDYAVSTANIYGADSLEMAMYLTALAKTESTFNPAAENPKSTARGLMQILICTQREIEKKYAKVEFADAMFNCKQYPKAIVPQEMDKMFNPAYSMLIASHYLGYQFRRYSGDWDKAIYAWYKGSYKGIKEADGKAFLKKVLNNVNDSIRLATKIKNNKLIIEYY